MKIYTRTGDRGTTALFFGRRVPKTHERIEAIGAADELNAALGVARGATVHVEIADALAVVQGQLFVLGGGLAAPGNARAVVRTGPDETGWLEAEIDRLAVRLPELRAFILPGGTPAGAQLHVARTVCRRAERAVLRLGDEEREAAVYLNRLSDFLFTLARWENFRSGVAETEWHPAKAALD